MSTDPQLLEVRELIHGNHFFEALDVLKRVEATGIRSPEIEFDRGLCLAALGRTTEARCAVKHLNEQGHPALAHQLADRIAEENPIELPDLADPESTIVPPYPKATRAATPLLTVVMITAAAVVILAMGVLIGIQVTRSPQHGIEPPSPSASASAAHPDKSKSSPQDSATDNVPNPDLTGQWQCVDFVRSPDEFVPGDRQFAGSFSLNWVEFYTDGNNSIASTWKDGWITDTRSNHRAEYQLKQVSADTFMFYPWMTDDVTVGGEKPQFYVLKKITSTVTGNPPGPPQAALVARSDATQGPAVQWEQGSLDLTGTWTSVDFVRDPTQFIPGKKFWKDDLFLTRMECYADGATSMRISWNNGMITDLNSGYQAAYDVKTANGRSFLFFPWISGDVTARGQKPAYYVLERS